jgi:adenylate cyclase
MGTELERRFLVLPDRLPRLLPGVEFVQGYVAFEPNTVRVRISPKESWLAVKGPGLLERAEFEYPIPRDDALALLALTDARIVRLRHEIEYEGNPWVINRMLGRLCGLWIAEIELPSRGHEFPRPPWAGQEVTYNPVYSNVWLARCSTCIRRANEDILQRLCDGTIPDDPTKVKGICGDCPTLQRLLR